MSGTKTNKITNANIYLDGASQLGKAEEIDLGTLNPMMEEHKALGMVGKIELPSGWDKLEGKIKWNSYYPDVAKKFANPLKGLKLQVRGSLETWGPGGIESEVPCVCFLTVTSKNFPLGNFKQHNNVELESSINILYVKLEIDGAPIVEYDPLSNIYKVDGVDILANFRNNLGI